MSQENVETFKRAVEAANRRDVEAFLDEHDPDAEWHPAVLGSLEGDAEGYRGHDGIRRMLRDVYATLAEFHAEYADIRDLGDRVVAIGRVRIRGKESGAETESPYCAVVDVSNGKAIRVRTYLDPQDALEAAGLPE